MPGFNTVVLLFGLIALMWVVSKLIRIIPNNMVGIVERLWMGPSIPSGHTIATKKEIGFGANILRGGIHFFVPTMFNVHTVPLVTIPQGKIGYIYARDGEPLPPGQT